MIKYIIPIIAVLSFGGGTFFGVKFLDKKCPDCKPQLTCPSCPEQKPCNGIDYDKIKSKYLTIENTQYLTVQGDSILIDRMKEVVRGVVREEFKDFKVRKCK